MQKKRSKQDESSELQSVEEEEDAIIISIDDQEDDKFQSKMTSKAIKLPIVKVKEEYDEKLKQSFKAVDDEDFNIKQESMWTLLDK